MSNYDVKQEVTDKYSLRGRVFNRLREDILSGRYAEHEELREVTIGEEMGVSRTPVREAFRQLELEGLIQIIPNKGAYVTGITEKDVKDIYMIRSLLEGLCARWATEHISKEQMDEMEENVYLAEFHARKGHLEQLAELDNRFHDIMYEACDSKLLEHQIFISMYCGCAERPWPMPTEGRNQMRSIRRSWRPLRRETEIWRSGWLISI